MWSRSINEVWQLKSDPKALTLSESFYICRSNLLFIRHPAEPIKRANENVCVCHQGYLAVSASLFSCSQVSFHHVLG